MRLTKYIGEQLVLVKFSNWNKYVHTFLFEHAVLKKHTDHDDCWSIRGWIY